MSFQIPLLLVYEFLPKLAHRFAEQLQWMILDTLDFILISILSTVRTVYTAHFSRSYRVFVYIRHVYRQLRKALVNSSLNSQVFFFTSKRTHEEWKRERGNAVSVTYGWVYTCICIHVGALHTRVRTHTHTRTHVNGDAYYVDINVYWVSEMGFLWYRVTAPFTTYSSNCRLIELQYKSVARWRVILLMSVMRTCIRGAKLCANFMMPLRIHDKVIRRAVGRLKSRINKWKTGKEWPYRWTVCAKALLICPGRSIRIFDELMRGQLIHSARYM